MVSVCMCMGMHDKSENDTLLAWLVLNRYVRLSVVGWYVASSWLSPSPPLPSPPSQSRELPEQYQTELQGLSAGASAAGCTECGDYITRTIVLANAPGDLQVHVLYVYVYVDQTKCH